MFTGSPELYAVPEHSGVTSVTLKLWGAGGGGVLAPAAAMDMYGENGTSNATQGAAVGGCTVIKEREQTPTITLLCIALLVLPSWASYCHQSGLGTND